MKKNKRDIEIDSIIQECSKKLDKENLKHAIIAIDEGKNIGYGETNFNNQDNYFALLKILFNTPQKAILLGKCAKQIIDEFMPENINLKN